jgi:hypothetical protein
MQCRYAGHSRKFYSIAEHACHIHDKAPKELKQQALLHDASEAYLVDIPRPVKPYITGYYDIEDKIMKVIGTKFGFAWPMHPIVKELDFGILLDEKNAIMNPSEQDWNIVGTGIGATIHCWTALEAKEQFMERFYAHALGDLVVS